MPERSSGSPRAARARLTQSSPETADRYEIAKTVDTTALEISPETP